MNDPVDKTCLSYWFPKLQAAGLPMPKTHILEMPQPAAECLYLGLNGEDGGDVAALQAFTWQVVAACVDVGYPAFLRTSYTSHKHDWKRTCFVTAESGQTIVRHLGALAEFSECCDFIGLPWSKWVVREYLPVKPFGVCSNYGDMPVCREFRFFVEDDQLRCYHPYWPAGALIDGGWQSPDDTITYANLCALTDEQLCQLSLLAVKAGAAVGGAWSVDILETERGWFITDMAEAHKSYHWEGCEQAKREGFHR